MPSRSHEPTEPHRDLAGVSTRPLDQPMKLAEERVSDVIVRKLIDVMRLRDPELADHAQRTAEIATSIGAELGCSIDTLDRAYSAGQLHDIGKLGISEAILWKPTTLNRSEWRIVRSHPEDGHRLIADSVHREVAAAVLYHHERMDGHGYPFGIDGHTLPLVVRIVQVADAFDAMTSDRPYQPALSTPTAIGEIERCAGHQFDPDVAEALARIFREQGRATPPLSHLEIAPRTEPPPVAADPFTPAEPAPEPQPEEVVRAPEPEPVPVEQSAESAPETSEQARPDGPSVVRLRVRDT